MKSRPRTFRALLGSFLALALLPSAQAQEHLEHGRFKDVALYRPSGQATAFVLLLSATTSPRMHIADMANALAARGALVAGVDLTQLLAAFDAEDGDCVMPDGDLENLSHYVQGYKRLATYYKPILIGDGSAAAFVQIMLAQSPADLFSGGIIVGSNPSFKSGKPLCAAQQPPKNQPIRLSNIEYTAGSSPTWMPQFLRAYDTFAARGVSAAHPSSMTLADLPLVEVAAAHPGATFAVLLSGDGGWAGIDKAMAAALAEKGIPVVGFDSLRYFWKARTPQGLADDVDRILRYYAMRWKKSGALLIGYSQGADVLPFAVNRLTKASKALVTRTVLLNPGQNAAFEFHLDNWLGGDRGSLPIMPEVRKLNAASAVCVYGEDEDDALCPSIPRVNVRALGLPGGHHFDGEYARIVDVILGDRR